MIHQTEADWRRLTDGMLETAVPGMSRGGAADPPIEYPYESLQWWVDLVVEQAIIIISLP